MQVHVVGEVLPRPGDALDVGLAAELALGADLRATRVTSAANVCRRSTMALMVFLSSRISPFASTVIFCERSPLATAVVTSAMLRTWFGQVAGQQVDVVGEVLPGAGDALDVGLRAELALGADLPRDAGDLGGEGPQLIDHRVDGVLELEDLALRLDGDLLREIAVGDRGRRRGDVAHLRRQVARQQVDAVGELLPHARDAADVGLRAELALGADLARDADDLGGEGSQLIDRRVDGVLELEDLALASRR